MTYTLVLLLDHLDALEKPFPGLVLADDAVDKPMLADRALLGLMVRKSCTWERCVIPWHLLSMRCCREVQ